MALLNFESGYFAVENPLRILERSLHRYRHRQKVNIDRRELELRWTSRAERALDRRERQLCVELQLYFSCVVKKRVVFDPPRAADAVTVDPRLSVQFRALASAACDPVEFAADYPAARRLTTEAAAAMLPRFVEIDFRRGCWEGRFGY